MDIKALVDWMLNMLEKDRCLYHDDVVNYLIKNKQEDFLKENSKGNLVLKLSVNSEFKKKTEENVVWVKPERYWRYRVSEDEPNRKARG